jgi:hypothetical protein
MLKIAVVRQLRSRKKITLISWRKKYCLIPFLPFGLILSSFKAQNLHRDVGAGARWLAFPSLPVALDNKHY